MEGCFYTASHRSQQASQHKTVYQKETTLPKSPCPRTRKLRRPKVASLGVRSNNVTSHATRLGIPRAILSGAGFQLQMVRINARLNSYCGEHPGVFSGHRLGPSALGYHRTGKLQLLSPVLCVWRFELDLVKSIPYRIALVVVFQ